MSGVVARVAARLPRPEVLLLWLLGAHLVLKLLVYPLTMNAPAYNDEQQYYDSARALSNLLRDVFAFTAPDGAELERNVVASGWFMPGMGIVMTPLFVVFPDASDPLCRAYLGLASLAVLLWAVASVRKRLGPTYAALLVVFPGLLPSWVLMSFTAYGDPLSGIVLIVLVAHIVDMLRKLRAGRSPAWTEALQLGLLAVFVLYLRSSTSIVLAALGCATLVAALLLLKGAQRVRAVLAAGLAGVVFLLLLAPWSIVASASLDARVITTTTVPISLANTFGDREQVCFGKCDPDSYLWFRPLRYAREVGRATGESEVEVEKQMSDYALRDLERRDYARQAWWNIGSYFFIPANFVRYIEPAEGRSAAGEVGEDVVWWSTYLLYVPFLLLTLISMLFVQLRSLEAQILDTLAKLALLALFVQPFVHVAGSRYWTTAGPLFMVAAVGFVRESHVRRSHDSAVREDLHGTDALLSRWLKPVQLALSALFAVVLVGLGLMAI
ncbi:hypothetical protein [Nocardioides antri]|uniref:Glycosyltransferase RgtA/B/C/D-like domain-containing protein n=1 Tax=Nocardioides antri TaxID=2607659 RepID=A0A5B1M6Q9_9ACTN|nr:hypothetical protein [Nocardioides antri]KAA1428334.1 hypothetical protein F0U47_05225 [Nocardioides antri]